MSLINLTSLNPNSTNIINDVCMFGGKYDPVCIYQSVCNQLNTHFIKTGIGIVVFSIVVMFIGGLILSRYYKHITSLENSTREQRLTIMLDLYRIIIGGLCAYIVMIVYFMVV